MVKRRTAKGRFRRTLQALTRWCRRYRHAAVSEQHKMLSLKLRGHYAYFGITGNFAALQRLHHEVKAVWRTWLNRRSQRARMTWERMHRLLQRYPLPRPRIVRRALT